MIVLKLSGIRNHFKESKGDFQGIDIFRKTCLLKLWCPCVIDDNLRFS